MLLVHKFPTSKPSKACSVSPTVNSDTQHSSSGQHQVDSESSYDSGVDYQQSDDDDTCRTDRQVLERRSTNCTIQDTQYSQLNDTK